MNRMRKFFHNGFYLIIIFLFQGCYTKLLIPERTKTIEAKTISAQERTTQGILARPFHADLALLGTTWETQSVEIDIGKVINRISFAQNDQLLFSTNRSTPGDIARYRIFSDTMIVVFDDSKSIGKYLYKLDENGLRLTVLSRSDHAGINLVEWNSTALFKRIFR